MADGAQHLPAYLESHEGLTEALQPRPHRGIPLTDDDLNTVVRIYRAALATGEPPTQAVAKQMFVARSTAGRWVAAARERGLLGKAKPRAGGELDR